MTPYELAKTIFRDLSPIAPRLCAALNRALIDIGEGSVLVGLGPGTNENDNVSFQEYEHIALNGADPAAILSRIGTALEGLQNYSSWKVIIDRKPDQRTGSLELLYTLYRSKD